MIMSHIYGVETNLSDVVKIKCEYKVGDKFQFANKTYAVVRVDPQNEYLHHVYAEKISK